MLTSVIQRMDNSFFPENVAVCIAEDWMWEQPVFAEEEELLSATAVEKRLREFRAGRHCAHNALKQLHHTDFALLRGAGGAPVWPENICGSISHSGERCVAIAAHKKYYLGVAVDIEKNKKIKADTVERIAYIEEQYMLNDMTNIPDTVDRAAILFSIKECVHKIYYPLNKHTLDFKDVVVSLGGLKNSFDVKIINPAQQECISIQMLSGKFGCDENHVWSRICLKSDITCQ